MSKDETKAPAVTAQTLIRQSVLDMNAYHVPPAEDVIKLNAMENPFTWPPALLDDWLRCLSGAELNRYPDSAGTRVKNAIRKVFEIPEQLDIVLGNGSDELIQLLIMAVADDACVIMSPTPSFSMYEQTALAIRTKFVGVDLSHDFQLDVEAFLAAMKKHQPAMVFLAYPNNPTGNLFERADIERVIEAAPGLVVVDEAYEAFAGCSFIRAALDNPNLLILRTLSKSGFAGLRLGYLLGAPAWLGQFEKLRLPYNINTLTQLSCEFALSHYSNFVEQTEAVLKERALMLQALRKIDGLHVFDSQANFILFRVRAGSAGQVFDGLRQRGVLIKNFDTTHRALHDCLRVTIGSSAENRAFLSALQAVLPATRA